MTTPELIRVLNQAKQDLQRSITRFTQQHCSLEFIDRKRKQAKAIAAAVRLLTGTKRRKA